MNCDKFLDYLYFSEGRFPLIKRIFMYFHILHCPKCAAHVRALQTASGCMKEDFFPTAKESIAENIMALIQGEDFTEAPAKHELVTFRAWVISGLAILFSLSSVYFGIDYLTPGNMHTIYFMLPLGITVGGVITAFGAVFIGCHITELSKWLGLPPHSH
jgi:hypothetical protein